MRRRFPLLAALIALATSILLVSAASQTKPQTNEKNSFSAAEAEERSKIHGSWSVGALPDIEQAKAETVPVVLDRVEVFIGGGKKYGGMLKVTGAILNNRSPKTLRGVGIRWRIARKDDPAARLEGAVSPIETRIGANSRQHIDIPVINFTTAAQPLLKREFTYAEFVITLSISKAVFADGTTWEEANSAALNQGVRR